LRRHFRNGGIFEDAAVEELHDVKVAADDAFVLA
jgi:hypothetical protein